ncbi:MAG: hypothetical protein FD189_1072 [Elusimicrobia bacterium]|nr:MAG: hypothetical protein FD189_1072 [Elusimicrobiota bacterium]
MTMKRIRLSRAKGWKLPPNTVNVARPGPFGSPFKVGGYGTAKECVRAHMLLLEGGIVDYSLSLLGAGIDAQIACVEHFRFHWRDLIDKDVACWCKPEAICHGDTLLNLVAKLAARDGRQG